MSSKYHTFEVNKAKICIYPMESVRAAYVDLKIRTGSAYEEGRHWGAMHLIEHMLHQGTGKFSSRQELEIYKETHGLTTNAYTGSFELGAWVKFPQNETGAALELLDEIIFHSTIPEHQIAREVDVITQEYRDKWSDPQKRYNLAINSFLYGKYHIATRDGLGQPDFIKTKTRNELIELKDKFFQPQNMIVSIAGNVDVGQVQAKLKSILGKEKNSGKPVRLTKKGFGFKKPRNRILNHHEDVQNVSVNFIWHIDGYNELNLRQRLALGTAVYILGSSHGLLFKRLRQELGLVYQTGTDRYFYDYTGGFEIWALTKPDRLEKVVEEIKKIVENFILNKIPYQDFSRAGNFLDIQTLMTYDSVGGISTRIANNLFHDGRPISPEEYIKTAKPIKEKEIRELLARYINPKISPYITLMSKEKVKI